MGYSGYSYFEGPVRVPRVSVKSYGLCSYNKYESDFVKSPFRRLSVEEKRSLGWLTHDRTSQGVLSPAALKRLKNAVGWTISNAMFSPSRRHLTLKERIRRCSFITLTLPSKQRHTDQEIKNVALNNFLNYCRRELHTNAYCWRAEKQKNGNIHFHLVLDRYCHYTDVNRFWCASLESLGYIDEFQKGMKQRVKCLEDYKKEFGKGLLTSVVVRRYNRLVDTNFREPNCTDVHSLKKVKNAARYVTKYMSKCEDTELVKGKLWGCSQSISRVAKTSVDADSKLLEELESLAQQRPKTRFEGDFFVWYSVSIPEVLKLKLDRLLELFEDVLKLINNDITLCFT